MLTRSHFLSSTEIYLTVEQLNMSRLFRSLKRNIDLNTSIVNELDWLVRNYINKHEAIFKK